MNKDGSVDESFDPGAMVSGSVFDIELYLDKILVSGAGGLVALNIDGSKYDGFVVPSVGGEVFALDTQPDGKIVIGGNFKQINNISVNNIARLNKDGSLDLTFDSGNGPDGAVHSLSIDNHGILIGGIFVTYDGVSSRRIARLSLDGSINDNFDVRLGFDGPVQSIYKLSLIHISEPTRPY